MKRYIAILSLIVIISMCFSMVALGNDDYEMPQIPLTNSSSSGEDESEKGTGDLVPGAENGDTTGSGDDTTLPTTDPGFETPGVPLDAVKTSIKKCTISGITSKTYNGKAQTQKITVKYKGKTLVNKTDYTITYKNNKYVGTASVTIAGKGAYNEKVTKTFAINPRGTSLKKLTAGKKAFTASWTKQATQTTGYQIQYSTSSKFTAKTTKSAWATKNSTVKKTVKKLKGKKKYYVRIRTYKTVNKTKYYSAWSKAKTVTTKK